MVYINAEFIECNKVHMLGMFSMTGGCDEKSEKPFRYFFKIDTLKRQGIKYEQTLIPGIGFKIEKGGWYQNIAFFPCPLTVFYTQIEEIKQTTIGTYIDGTYHRDIFLAKLKIYNKDFLDWKIVEYKSNRNDYFPFPLLINFVNNFIAAHSDFNKLDFDNLFSEFDKPGWNNVSLEDLISKLKISFYSDSQSRPGKDNHFWTSAVVTNIETNRYFKNQIEGFFKTKYKSGNWNGDAFESTIESDYAWAASHSREYFDSPGLEQRIKLELGIYLAKEFEKAEFLFSKFSTSGETLENIKSAVPK
ncbi:MAG: hypothetical protein EOO46_01900 [Flavobacterium sp.]|nr:MAG: hypothetical protein EOO46_01900 [Flavobacterium sp.]